MLPRYCEKKATQAAVWLLHKEGGRMSHIKLIKLLYLADRQALLSWGRPLTFDWYVSLPHGPVLSFTLDKINTERASAEDSYWHTYISERQSHDVALLCSAPVDHLSPAEEVVLDDIYKEFGRLDQWQLRDSSRRLPEWMDPKAPAYRSPFATFSRRKAFRITTSKTSRTRCMLRPSLMRSHHHRWMSSVRAGLSCYKKHRTPGHIFGSYSQIP